MVRQNEKSGVIRVRNPTVYAFIDSQNLNLGVRSMGWVLDYRKFRLYLKNKYNVSRAFMFIGFVAGNQKLYTNLQKAGFILIHKPTITRIVNGVSVTKGNIDAELVLHAAAIEYPNYDKAIIVTNDGDFLCLVQYLEENQKLEKILTPNKKYSSLYKPYGRFILTLNNLKGSLAK
jgi:uncharacterized LabA/DUF88 family protein